MSRPTGSKNVSKGGGRKTRQEVLAEKRKLRTKVQDLRNSMAIDGELIGEGYVARWVNDEPGRIDNYLLRGWEFVQENGVDDVGEGSESSNNGIATAISQHAGTSKANRSMNAYLMRIEKELYDEGESAKQVEVDKIDDALQRQTGTFGVEQAHAGKAKLTNTVSGGGAYKP